MKSLIGVESLVALAVACGCPAVGAQDAGRTLTPGDLQWKPSTRVKGLEQADLIGSSTQSGPYVQRVRFPANFVNPPHSHPEERTYTIISGTWYVGWGTKLDESKLVALPPGSFYTEPANVPHFVLSKDEPVVVQISGTGPTLTRFVDPSQAPK
ncbi:MAG: cupin domain-containing protein [Burkholderiales bacterium]|nr:cupin domain-containing protein [Burkholderiales bacterium]